MKLTHDELEFLSAWAREEGEPACYQLPSHRLQLAHGVSGAQLLVFIKAWTEREGKKDLDILGAATNPQPHWPWSTAEEFGARFAEASWWRTHREGVKNASGAGGKRNSGSHD
jgi:hypothetical protein